MKNHLVRDSALGRLAAVLLCLPALWSSVAAWAQPATGRPAGLPSGPPTLADLAYGRGLALLQGGQPRAAVTSLRLAVDGRPAVAAYRVALANAYVALGADDAVFLAVEEYEHALKLDPGLDRARESLARAAWMVGLTSTTLDAMEALFAGSGVPRQQYAAELVTYYALAHEIDRGVTTFQKALPVASDPQPLRLLLAALYMQKSDKASARALVQRVLVESRPGSPLALQAQRMLEQGVGP